MAMEGPQKDGKMNVYESLYMDLAFSEDQNGPKDRIVSEDIFFTFICKSNWIKTFLSASWGES